jgi:hypothetical protein
MLISDNIPMSRIAFMVFGFIVLLSGSCVSVGKIGRHDFDSGFYSLKVVGSTPSRVYAEVVDDSIIIFPSNDKGNIELLNTFSSIGARVSRIKPDNYFYRSCFRTNAFDVDLTSILFKSRQSRDDVPTQFSADLNFAIFTGFRRDLYKIVTPFHARQEVKSRITGIGFDLGVFAGIGSTPVNPTVTNDKISQQYDGMIFQKGVAGFLSINKISLGLALGFDNLLDKNKSSWIYNQKPYLGLIISVSNF